MVQARATIRAVFGSRAGALALALALAGCGGGEPSAEREPEAAPPERPAEKDADGGKPEKAQGVTVNRDRLSIFEPLPAAVPKESNPFNPAKVELGRMLYYEKRLSVSHQVSCNTCHPLDAFGVDGKPVSTGHEGQKGNRNAPTVYNAAGQIAQFWDGRAEDVEDQATKPILNPVEMAMPSKDYALRVLRSIPEYVALFEKAFEDEGEGEEAVTFERLGKAIGAFERKLMTPAPFDAFLEGDRDALTDGQKKGLKTFMNAGCIACHRGARIGGQMYRKAGLIEPWPTQDDPGRYKVTGKEGDRMKFKVPILRNVAETGPYFHDGSVDDLSKAIRMMGRHQLGKDLSDEKVAAIESFLTALTGEIPADYIERPELPPSTEATPKPEG